MKKKVLVVNILTLLLILTLGIFLKTGIIGTKKDEDDIKHISLVYRSSNYAYGRNDDLYIVDEYGDVYYRDMKQNPANGDTLINIILNLHSETDSKLKTVGPIPDDIKQNLTSSDLDKLKYKKQKGSIDAISNIYYVLIERNNDINLIKLSESGSCSITAKSLNMEQIYNYVASIIKD